MDVRGKRTKASEHAESQVLDGSILEVLGYCGSEHIPSFEVWPMVLCRGECGSQSLYLRVKQLLI